MTPERDDEEPDRLPEPRTPDSGGKNIVICLDGTGNQFGKNLSNVVKLFRMLEREPGVQIAYYDPGVGTMGDPSYKTATARKINKWMGLAFGRGLMKNLIEAYTYLMQHYEDGDRVFIFGFSRGAYTARALAAFIKECGLFERGAENLLPYAMGLFLKKAPRTDERDQQEEREEQDEQEEAEEDEEQEFYKLMSSFRSTYGRLLNRHEDPRYPGKKPKKPNYQLRVHFLGLFDTVKSYGWVSSPVILRNETKNDSVLNVRHALAIDEKRIFFRQMHWKASNPKYHTCKEVWFPGVHSDVGGGYPEGDSGLAKIALEWMVHEACTFGLKVDPKRYGRALQRRWSEERGEWEPRPIAPEDEGKYSAPDATAPAHESLKAFWKIVQKLSPKLASWEESKHWRSITSERERLEPEEKERDRNPLRVHESVLERMKADEVVTITTPATREESPKARYVPKNLLSSVPGSDIANLPPERVERTKPPEEVLG